jgi:hypothetical protein
MSQQQQITVKPEPGAMKYVESAAKDLKGAIDGGLDKAMTKVLDLVKSTADPALGMLLGQLNSETSESRMLLMKALMDLVESDGVQAGLTMFNWALNEGLIVIAKIVTEIAKVQDAFGNLDEKFRAMRISIDAAAVHAQFGDSLNSNGEVNPPPSGEIQESVGHVVEAAPTEYAWWDPRGWGAFFHWGTK